MNSAWEDTFRLWGKGPGQTERTKYENAERMINDAIREDEWLSNLTIEVFAHGSFKNRTNVRQNGDVDVCVCLKDAFFYDLPTNPPNTPEHFGFIPASVSHKEFKGAVERALVEKFGRSGVTRGNKALDIRENTYRVDADVVAALEHRRYTGRYNTDGTHYYLSGIEIHPDKGGRIVNWPEQTYDNGVAKNEITGRRYKAVIRILKRLRNEMQEDDISAANDVASFLIESLVWNVSNEGFGHDKYADDVRYAIAYAYQGTTSDDQCNEWGEVNELKYLFRAVQPWSRKQANDFLYAAWNYVGFD